MDASVRKRESKWVCVCNLCQHERFINYAQAFNIAKGICKRECKSCQISNGIFKHNLDGLKAGRSLENQVKAAKSRIGLKRSNVSAMLKMTHLFNPRYAVTSDSKVKQQQAKTGKIGILSNAWKGGETVERKALRRKKQNEYTRERLKKDKVFYAIKLARNRASEFIRSNGVQRKSRKLGCNYQVFKEHIESQFKDGMSWDNYGKWHLDHIFPLSIAAKMGDDKLFKCFHYTNLQPLWAIDNIKKGNRI